MYFTDNGFVISLGEIIAIIVIITIGIIVLQIFRSKFRNIIEINESNDCLVKFSDIADKYKENNLDSERREKVYLKK